MRLVQSLCVCLLLASTALLSAESKNPADYPLRILIVGHTQTTFYSHRYAEEFQGQGRANLFENDDVRGVDFTYDCGNKLAASFGYETYPARWKKQNQELVVLFPVFGKSNAYFTCNIHTDVKDSAYYRRHNGSMTSESPAEYKAWMIQHDYDPEHDKNTPINLAPQPAVPEHPGAPSQ